MLKRIISAVLGGLAAGNGLYMLAAGARWYERTPSVSDTGPFNPHFVADIGAAFLVGGLALLVRAWKPQYWPAAVAAAGFFAAHGIIHVIGVVGGQSHHAGFEWVAVIVPSALALWAAFPEKGETHV